MGANAAIVVDVARGYLSAGAMRNDACVGTLTER